LDNFSKNEEIAMSSPALTPEHILQTGTAFWASKTLLSAVEMEVFTELAKHPEDLDTLTGRLGLHPRSSRDFLDTLVALGFLERQDGVYSNTQETDLFLDKRKPSYIGGMLEMANQRLYPHWNNLTRALRTGQPQGEGGPGDETFASLYADPKRLKFPWAKYTTVADMGPAQGDLLAQIALKNPHLTCLGFDLPEVGPVFEEYMEENGLQERVRFQGGSFFTDAMPKADVITMGHVLHDWNLEEKRLLLCRKAAP
jgi:hypothetical protein